MKQIKLPDGNIGQFPDNMSNTDIETVLQKHYPTPTANKPEDIASDPISGRVVSAVSGLASGGADIVQGAADTLPFILKHLHLISPDTANKMYQVNKEGTAIFRPSDQRDVFNKAATNYPGTYGTSKIATDIAGMAAGAKAIPTIGTAASSAAGLLSPSISNTAGVVGRSLGMGLLNQAGADPENKNFAFGVGMALQPASELVAKGVAALGTKTKDIQELQKIAIKADNSKAISNSLYNTVKKASFLSEDQGKTYQISNSIKDFIEANPNLPNNQLNALKKASDDLILAPNHEIVLNTLQKLKTYYNIFKGTPTFEYYGNLKGQIGDVLNNAVGRTPETIGALSMADELTAKRTMTRKVLGDIVSDPDLFKRNDAIKTLNKYIYNLKSNPDSTLLNSVIGLKKLVSQLPSDDSLMGMYAAHRLGANIGAGALGGGMVGYEKGGWSGGILGMGLGLIGGAVALKSINHILNSPKGMEFLSSLAKPSVTMKDVGNVLKAAIASGINAQANPDESTEPNPTLQQQTPQKVSLNDYQPLIPKNQTPTPTMPTPPVSQTPTRNLSPSQIEQLMKMQGRGLLA